LFEQRFESIVNAAQQMHFHSFQTSAVRGINDGAQANHRNKNNADRFAVTGYLQVKQDFRVHISKNLRNWLHRETASEVRQTVDTVQYE
jgi:hypothetical protein